jgi:hypothetical protein
LYLAYRYAIDAPLTVRKAKVGDANHIYSIVQDLPFESEIVSALLKCRVEKDNNTPDADSDLKQRPACIVAEAYGQMVGVLIMEHADATDYVQQFDLENFIMKDLHKLDGSVHTKLHSFVLNPLFVPYSKSILGEACRLLGTSALFYPCMLLKFLSICYNLNVLFCVQWNLRRVMMWQLGSW